jgi:hypothetical protein
MPTRQEHKTPGFIFDLFLDPPQALRWAKALVTLGLAPSICRATMMLAPCTSNPNLQICLGGIRRGCDTV